jgi:DNA invertase Pin-like site-specific DNA recombinase
MPVALEYAHLVYAERLPLRGLLYGRNSVDMNGQASSVADQLSNGHDLCEEFGIEVAGEFKDPGVSASRYGNRNRSNPRRATTKTRDDFEALLAAVRAKEGDVVIAFEANRYYRDLEQYVQLRNACMEADVLLCYNRTIYDLSKKEDRKITAQDAIAAEEEVDNIHDRAVRTAFQHAKDGRPWGPLLFGFQRRYDPDTGDLIGQFLHKVQAPIAQQCWIDVDAGKTTYSVAKWLNSLGKKAQRATGIPWTPEHVRDMLLNPAYIGKRVYFGEVIGDAQWPPLLEGEEGLALFQRVKTKLLDPARKTAKESKVNHLLSRIALCGECGDHALLTAGKRNRGVQYLNCTESYDTALREDWMDAWVETAVMEWLSSPAAREAFFPKGGERENELKEVRGRLKTLTDQLTEARDLATELDEETGAFRLSPMALSTLEKALAPKIKAAEARVEELTAGVPQTLKELILAADPWLVWFGDEERGEPGLSLEQKRDVLRKIVTVRLFKASGKGIRTLEPGRIKVAFVGQPGFIPRPISKKEFAKAQQEAAVRELEAARSRRRRRAKV